MKTEEILLELPDGVKVIRKGVKEYIVETPYRPNITINPRWNRHRIYTLCLMESYFQGLPASDPGTIPIEIVMEGKPMIAAYLFAYHKISVKSSRWDSKEDPETVASIMEIAESTATQYVSDARSHLREQIESR